MTLRQFALFALAAVLVPFGFVETAVYAHALLELVRGFTLTHWVGIAMVAPIVVAVVY